MYHLFAQTGYLYAGSQNIANIFFEKTDRREQTLEKVYREPTGSLPGVYRDPPDIKISTPGSSLIETGRGVS